MDVLHGLTQDIYHRSDRLGRPVVTLSYAQSLDGSLTTQANMRLMISGAESKLLTHQLRAVHQGILIGIGTLLTDNPRLTARLAGGPHPQPVILDGSLRTPSDCALMQREDLKPWIFCREDVPVEREQILAEKGARIFRVKSEEEDGRLSLGEILRSLKKHGMSSVMVEGGAEVIASFLLSRLVDQVVITIAPFWAGGVQVRGNFLREGQLPEIIDPQMMQLGRDMVIWGLLGEGNHEAQDAVFHGARRN
ncbi:MAG TPA: GTP cyclohydrolase [Anaerolinea thermolimosa]|uniref:GTP cyclohydrolase n=1 Tax=Anaerolinea thermolimosa TaxID=229919 RepID=A0A3D1JHW3_9CHLR|nr:dihydrofolate reductase family protein [Anaerolinea thermolimosa]GAP07063.1 pyrimidine reductase, riboflavin biosynthesis [Anaerolinea thermolimosa]HCE18092.1 GTP cyclohydrolase [Anaerolinea thermolimosa]